MPEVKLKKVAHALNQLETNNEECDSCNENFSIIEQDFLIDMRRSCLSIILKAKMALKK